MSTASSTLHVIPGHGLSLEWIKANGIVLSEWDAEVLRSAGHDLTPVAFQNFVDHGFSKWSTLEWTLTTFIPTRTLALMREPRLEWWDEAARLGFEDWA